MTLDDDDLMARRIGRACDRIWPGITFDKWLLMNYKKTVEVIMQEVPLTGDRSDTVNVLNWYRKRYEFERNLVQRVTQLKIFDFMEVNKHGI